MESSRKRNRCHPLSTGHADLPHRALGQNITPSSTARHAQARKDVRDRSTRAASSCGLQRVYSRLLAFFSLRQVVIGLQSHPEQGALLTPARSNRMARSGQILAWPLTTRDNAVRDMLRRLAASVIWEMASVARSWLLFVSSDRHAVLQQVVELIDAVE